MCRQIEPIRLGEVGSNTAKLRFTVGETHNERRYGKRKEIPTSTLLEDAEEARWEGKEFT